MENSPKISNNADGLEKTPEADANHSDLPSDIGFVDTSILDAVSSTDYSALNLNDMEGDTLVSESPLKQKENPPMPKLDNPPMPKLDNPPMPKLDNPPPSLDPANPVTRALNEIEQTKTRIGLDVTTVALPKGYRIQEQYEIVNVIGSGGFATVYRALRLEDRQEVAIKVMDLKKCGDQKVSKRFLREAEIAADIHHPNVTKSYDFGYMEDTGQPFIVMELLHGHDLTTELKKNGPLSPRRAFMLFRPVVDALAAGHKIGVVHKDLKPDNFFIVNPGTQNECMKILDYGIAYLKNEAMRLTSDGQIVGTPRYLAPEYIRSRDVSAAIDVYQVALIISEALTRVPAITGEAFQAMMHHCAGNLSVANFLLYDKVGEVFCKAWAIEPEDRYHNCVEFGKALDSIANEFKNKTQIDARITPIVTPDFKPLSENPAPSNPLQAPLPQAQPPIPNTNAEVVNQQEASKPQKKNNRKTIVILLAILALCTCQGMWYILTKYSSPTDTSHHYLQNQPGHNQLPPSQSAASQKAQPAVDIKDLCKMAAKAAQRQNYCEAYDLYQLAIEKGLRDTECRQEADAIINKYAAQCKE
ncbi:MAG: protein kinase [Proteobacteria bacterium]|nr:protein kinase [Pseudomonadota bacterium]